MNVRLNGEELQEVGCFKYLGSAVVVDGGPKTEIRAMVKETEKVLGGMNRLFERSTL